MSSHSKLSVRIPQLPPSTEGLSLHPPTVGLFIGVSEYGERAGVNSTPAHTLSAALVYEPFYHAATQAQMEIRKEQLGIPVANHFNAHRQAVCAVIFTPDGSKVISAAQDGSIVARPTDSPEKEIKIAEPVDSGSRESCHLAVSEDGSLLAAAGPQGTRVWALSGEGTSILLAHTKASRTVSFNPDSSRLVATSSDRVTRVFSTNGTREPLELTGSTGCWEASVAEFSPDGQMIAVASCKDVWLARADNPAGTKLLGQHAAVVVSLSFSPDRSKFATAGRDGTRVWPVTGTSVPIQLPILTKGAQSAGVAEKVVFSPDGTRVAIGYSEGFVEIRQADGRGTPVTLPARGKGIVSLQFSADGESVLAATRSGTAWVRDTQRDTKVEEMPRPLAPKSHWDTVSVVEALDKRRLPPKPARLRVQACSFSPDSRRIAVAYHDGSVAIHPGVPDAEDPGLRTEDLILLADLKLDRVNPNSRMALEYLMQLDGAPRNMMIFRPAGAAEDATSYYVGGGQQVTRERLLGALERALEKSQATLAVQDRVVLIVYVSAHGWIGPDGRTYLLPADADGHDPNTWIAYEDFLKPIRAFLTEENGKSAVPKEEAEMRKLAIVIFDTCQIPRDGNLGKVAATPDLSQPGLVVVQSTSPGRYAWHWTETMHSEENITVEKERRWGFPPPPKAKRGKFETTLSTKMSVLPIASQMKLNQLVKQKALQPDGDGLMITASEWLGGTRDFLEQLLVRIPDAQHPDLKGAAGQEVQGQVHPTQRDFWLFRVEPSAIPKPPEPEKRADPPRPQSSPE